MSADAQLVFRVLEKWGLIVCEPCQYVVWPKHILSGPSTSLAIAANDTEWTPPRPRP
jgi:hypothetical protein